MRLPKKEYFMSMAHIAAMRSTCLRRNVGCVLVDRHDHVIATGYNGSAKGIVNCVDSFCARDKNDSGESLELCEAIHAEMNALLQCRDTQAIVSAYITDSPCIHCVKLLMNTSCETIYYTRPYSELFEDIKYRWENSSRMHSRRMIHVPNIEVKYA